MLRARQGSVQRLGLSGYSRCYWTSEGTGASLVAQMVKNLPAMQETWVRSLGWEDPLEKGMATHSSIFAWMHLVLESGKSRHLFSPVLRVAVNQ